MDMSAQMPTPCGPRSVAIIGCGMAGTSAFYQLVMHHPVKRVVVFEAHGTFGPGYAYGTDECRDYLINNTNDTMCLEPRNREAFINWLRSHPVYGPTAEPKAHAPRAVYGEFLIDAFNAARVAAAVKGIDVELVAEEVTSLEEREDGTSAIGWEGNQTTVDAVLLTTGKSPILSPIDVPAQTEKATYYVDHVRNVEMDDIPLDATIHVLGASLSAYDVINRAFSTDTGCRFERDTNAELQFIPGPNQRKVRLVSRSGRLKQVNGGHAEPLTRNHFSLQKLIAEADEGGITLAQIDVAIKTDAEENGVELDVDAIADPFAGCANLDDVQDRAIALLDQAIASACAGNNFIVNLFQDAQNEMWRAFIDNHLSVECELEYRRSFESATLSYAAPCPIPTAEKLRVLLRAGRVQVFKGVRDVTYDHATDAFSITHEFGTETADHLINAAGGADRDVASASQPALVKSLVQAGLMQNYARDGVILPGAMVDPRGYRLPNSKNIYMANMLLWGPGFFTSSAYLMASIVKIALAQMFAPQTAEIPT